MRCAGMRPIRDAWPNRSAGARAKAWFGIAAGPLSVVIAGRPWLPEANWRGSMAAARAFRICSATGAMRIPGRIANSRAVGCRLTPPGPPLKPTRLKGV
jgi:hypothetical protein